MRAAGGVLDVPGSDPPPGGGLESKPGRVSAAWAGAENLPGGGLGCRDQSRGGGSRGGGSRRAAGGCFLGLSLGTGFLRRGAWQ